MAELGGDARLMQAHQIAVGEALQELESYAATASLKMGPMRTASRAIWWLPSTITTAAANWILILLASSHITFSHP